MGSTICFSCPCLLPHNARSISLSRRIPVCVLEKSSSPPPIVAPVVNPVTRTTKPIPKKEYYHVVSPSVSEKDLPPPPPVHRSVPFVGYILESMFKLSTARSRAKRFNGIYTTDFLIRKMTFVTETEYMVDMIKNKDLFRSSGSSRVLEDVFGKESMILLDDHDHAVARGVLAPAFSSKLFPFYLDIIRAKVEESWARVERAVAKEGKALLDHAFRTQYLSIIIKLTTGIDIDTERAAEHRKRFVTIQKGFFSPPYGPIWDMAMKAKHEMLEILVQLVDEYLVEKADLIEKVREYGDKLSYRASKDIVKGEVNILIIALAFSDLKTGKGADNNVNTKRRIASLTFGLWFAGYATTAATTTCASLELGFDRDIWNQLQTEQDRIVAAEGSKKVMYDQITTKMPLLESYITEILRMYPAAIGVTRRLNEDAIILGHHVKAGSVFFFDFQSVMRDERLYKDPDTLKIDRFLKEKGKMSVPKILTFGGPGSAHFCLGAALAGVLMKTTLSVLLREYDMELDPRQSKEYTVVPEIVPKSKVVVRSFQKRLR